MKILVTADIHGHTPELQTLVDDCCPGAQVLSPWAGEGCPFAREAEAHAAFLAAGGLESYAARLTQVIAQTPVFILGFSVGATAAWLYAAQPQSHPASRGMLFYGSRIRYYRELNPHFPVQLIFAEREAAFDSAALAANLARPDIRIEIVPGTAHGFMNPLSPGFSQQALSIYRERLHSILPKNKV
jgi:dienelactone hydrolase